ncbi:sensor histidine kinase [Pseudothauera nasutitermitis]|uniref:C4-dicarboxylate transport sensor protein DctB n=1 Tax=Pseudothauera nasutitermitis TaxID=2565930 RepID=A0A4S4AZE3_9RHOO|nr:ATP-binding protein [Pseudothauera nasutitermitis]THF65548.1 sensor histidine kinase [Pseudothauera nasutitermitis]
MIRVPRLSLPFRVLAAVALVCALAAFSHRIALDNGLRKLRDAERHRLELISLRVQGVLARFEYLPSLLETAPDVMALFDTPADDRLRDTVNRYLHGVNSTAGAEMLYVLDLEGLAIAAADADQPGTPLGTDLSFRPYVRDALRTGHGRFFGLGVTSGRPGYYLSYALPRDGAQRGIATVKIGLADIERDWKQNGGEVLLTDENGVVILTSRPEWRFRPLRPLSAARLRDIGEARPYGDAPLAALDWRELSGPAQEPREVVLEGKRYVASSRALEHGDWHVYVLDDETAVRNQALSAALIAALGGTVLLLAGLLAWQRQRTIRARLRNQAALQAAHAELERDMAARTAELRAARDELVQAGKMAALGQMSAGLAHELNQPLAAMHALADNTVVLMEHGRETDVRSNLQRLTQLVDRLARITRQLKVFSHKPSAPPAPTSVARALANAEFLVAASLRQHGVTLRTEIDPPVLQVLADETRLEQMLVNLLRNAIDAVTHGIDRRIHVCAHIDGERVRIRVDDSGPGIRADILPRLFEPFTTSKQAGVGLGLGLSLSAHIARELGGSLSGGNLPGGGARFEIVLARAPDAPTP